MDQVGATMMPSHSPGGGPLVSVVIPFLNAGRFLQEALDSVFQQTHENWDLSLVDDGSTDGSTDIALQCALRNPGRVRYLEHPGHRNRGASASRNLGSAGVRGKYIAFLDADDVWLPNKLERQVAILESQPQTAMVYGPGQWWYSWTGKPEDVHRDFVPDLGIATNTLVAPPRLVIDFLQKEDAVPSSFAVLIRRDVLERVGGSEEACRSIYDDQVVFAKIGLEAPVFVSDECWYRYRQHADQRCSVTAQSGQYDSVRYFYLAWLEKYVGEHNIRHGEIRKVLRRELRPYRHPHLDRFLTRAQHIRSRIFGLTGGTVLGEGQ
jgi:glycosyltransferase involved in cell wall biosynthesis